MLDLHTDEHGYTEVNPPLLVRSDVICSTAQLPKFEIVSSKSFGIAILDNSLTS